MECYEVAKENEEKEQSCKAMALRFSCPNFGQLKYHIYHLAFCRYYSHATFYIDACTRVLRLYDLVA